MPARTFMTDGQYERSHAVQRLYPILGTELPWHRWHGSVYLTIASPRIDFLLCFSFIWVEKSIIGKKET